MNLTSGMQNNHNNIQLIYTAYKHQKGMQVCFIKLNMPEFLQVLSYAVFPI